MQRGAKQLPSDMALSAPNTPRSKMCTPRRIQQRPLTSLQQTPECFSKVVLETPKSIRRLSNGSKSDKSYDELSNLTVTVRIRPMNTKELKNVSVTDAVIKTSYQQLTIRSNVTGGNSLNLDHLFQYDHVFCSCNHESDNYASQKDVFDTIGMPLLDNAFRGYNACLFAYGQTGSGKSYSMMGDNTGDNIDIDNNCGITPRFCKELFKRTADLQCLISVEVSYFEIYNEKIHDLLSANTPTRTQALKVREHPEWGPYVVDLSIHPVSSYKDLRSWLVLGNKNRATAATAMNEKSSRSHSIFTIEVSSAEGHEAGDVCRRSKISLVDLAGSERLSQFSSSGSNNDERLRQGVSINKSLLTLGKVISALAEQRKGERFIPYRESVLTWLLKESLGGNSLTSMLATISPASCNIEETLATLRYACQARSIVNRARINENPHDKLIRELRSEVERLRALRQTYERNSVTSTIYINDSTEHEQELDKLRDELKNTEQRLKNAETSWEQRFTATKEAQLRELAVIEKRKEDLESHLRVIQKSDTTVTLSPYKSNFLQDLEMMLKNKDKENHEANDQTTKKLGKHDIKASMDQIYNALSILHPTVNESPENIKLMFARINKLLQAFESNLISSVVSEGTEKTVTFNV